MVLIPLIYTFSSTTKLPLMYLGIPLSASLSIAHGYLPPHPAPTYFSFVYGADVNHVLMYGLVPVIPACLIAGILLSKFFRNMDNKPPKELYEERHFKKEELPGLAKSILTALSPVLLMLTGAGIDIALGPPPAETDWAARNISSLTDFYHMLFIDKGFSPDIALTYSYIVTFFKFLSDANIALMVAVFIGFFTLGLRNGRKMPDLMKAMGKSVGAIAMIILFIAAGGAFSQVLKDSQINHYIGDLAKDIRFNPLILAFCVSAVIRFAVGSATVATMTAAPIMVPIAVNAGISPELMVLATGSGSLMFSHFNDIDFWMFKEYYNVTIKQTFAIWTVMECLVAIVGLAVSLILHMFT